MERFVSAENEARVGIIGLGTVGAEKDEVRLMVARLPEQVHSIFIGDEMINTVSSVGLSDETAFLALLATFTIAAGHGIYRMKKSPSQA